MTGCVVTVWISMIDDNFFMMKRWGNPTLHMMWKNKHHIILWAYSVSICLFFGDLPILISTIITVVAAPLPTFAIGHRELWHLESWRPAWWIVLFWRDINLCINFIAQWYKAYMVLGKAYGTTFIACPLSLFFYDHISWIYSS